jgi:broad specificity phosphatase PhoE
VRHGDTAWTISGQHTGVTDLPLTTNGEAQAVRLGERVAGLRFAARWLGLEPAKGKYFLLGTASLSALGYEHDRSEPAIRLWDEI